MVHMKLKMAKIEDARRRNLTKILAGLIVLFFLHVDCKGFGDGNGRVIVEDKDDHVVMNNGILNVTIQVPEGLITRISYNGLDNLLNHRNRKDNRGYWDLVWKKWEAADEEFSHEKKATTKADANGSADAPDFLDKLLGTKYRIIVQNDTQAEISCTRTWQASNGDEVLPVNIDKRFVMLQGSSGFYTYTIMERLKGWPGCQIQESRVAFKLRSKFKYMVVSDTIQRWMPKGRDRTNGQVLDYKEAVLLKDPENPNLKGEVDDKYFYSLDNKDNRVHGWISTDPSIGFWLITPSDEFRAAGPFKLDLTSHFGPTALAMFFSTHYAGEKLAVTFQEGEAWKKVFGPVFVYLNTDPTAKSNASVLWNDAKARMSQEVASWPYAFPMSTSYVKADQRAVVSGTLMIRERFTKRLLVPAAFAYVGLAPPGVAGSWQTENKGYQFWVQAEADGSFSINNVIPGSYNLFASVPGFIGDYINPVIVHVPKGGNLSLGQMEYEPPRTGPTYWEIGYPDRMASEFFIPDPPSWVKPHQYGLPVDRWRQYGLWSRYGEMYPHSNQVFTVGISDYKKDWFFAHVSKKSGDAFNGTTWQVVFHLDTLNRNGTYTLQLALASANLVILHVRFNNPQGAPLFSTGFAGRDNSIARHGIHGLYRLYSVNVPNNVLVRGRNTLFLTTTRVVGPFSGLMYDYIRFEGP